MHRTGQLQQIMAVPVALQSKPGLLCAGNDSAGSAPNTQRFISLADYESTGLPIYIWACFDGIVLCISVPICKPAAAASTKSVATAYPILQLDHVAEESKVVNNPISYSKHSSLESGTSS